MSSAGKQIQETVHDEVAPIGIPTTDLVMALWLHRRQLIIVTGLGLLLAIVIALLMPNEYQSIAQLMPPDAQSFSTPSMLNLLNEGGGASTLSSAGVGLMSTRTPGSTAIAVLKSRTVQDNIIDRFDLRRVYHRKLYLDARKELTERSTFSEDKKSGIITIIVTDNDRYRAKDIASAYVEELSKLVNSLSTSSARRERVFLENRLKSIKAELDTSSRALSSFSSRNAVLDIQKQGVTTMGTVQNLQTEWIAAQSALSGLKSTYTDDNVRVREAQGRVDELKRQLKEMITAGINVNVVGSDPGKMLPSIRELPDLAFTYNELYRSENMEAMLFEALTKQYEFAKVKESEEIPPIEVLDSPQVPETKSGPHRTYIALFGFFLSAFTYGIWIVACKKWELTDDSHPAKALAIQALQGIRRSNSKREPR